MGKARSVGGRERAWCGRVISTTHWVATGYGGRGCAARDRIGADAVTLLAVRHQKEVGY